MVSEDKIRPLGMIAIVGGLLNVVADLLILSQPIETFGQGIKVLEIMPLENVRIGVMLGLIAITMWLLVLPALSAGLVRATTTERWVAIASFTLFVTASSAFHSLYWPMTVAIHATAGSEFYDLITEDLESALTFFQGVILLSLAVLTLDLASAVMRKRADYPWWILLISPLVLFVTLGNLVEFIPASYRGYAAGIMTTVFTTVFMAGIVLARRPPIQPR